MDVNGILISQNGQSTNTLTPTNISWLMDHFQMKSLVDNILTFSTTEPGGRK